VESKTTMDNTDRKRWVFRVWAIGGFIALCGLAWCASRSHSAVSAPWYGIVPPLLAVMLAMLTNRMLLSLAMAVISGGMLSAWGNSSGTLQFFTHGTIQAGRFLIHSVKDPGSWEVTSNQLILAHVVLIMTMISVMLVAGGLQGVASWLVRFARTTRSTKLVTMAAGLVIFIDDYANTMIIGSTLRPVTDRQRISREKLAFLVDATAAPIAGIAVISTWIGYEVGLLSEIAGQLGIAEDGYAMFFDALGFRFYCIGMIGFVFFNALSDRDFGPMAVAERRARETGKLVADGELPMTAMSMTSAKAHSEARVFASVALVPLLALLGAFLGRLWFDSGGTARLAEDPASVLRLSIWREVFSAVDGIPLLAYASAVGFLAAALLAVVMARIPLRALARAVVMGVRASLLPVSVLILAWSLKGACDDLDTGKFLAGLLADRLPPMIFPALVFIIASMTAFATGTSFGTMAILIPTAVPVAFELDGGYGLVTILSIAAVLDGAVFGDHCSPISDTTIMSSTASACSHMAHVRTQIPYSLVVAGFALCAGYLPTAVGAPKWFGISAGIGLSGLLFLGLWLFSSKGNTGAECR
jgi:Na+/H+ antiporter NhaC